jgi:hypothetical protein
MEGIAMIPLWYTACCMAAAGVAGYLCSQLWPFVTKEHVARERRRLERERRRKGRVVAELRRLTSWPPPAVRWEAEIEDNWPSPVSPRLTDLGRIEPAQWTVIDVPVVVAAAAVRHAAAPADIDWHRNEHRAWTWGRLVEMLARLASVGKTFTWRPEEHALVEYQPKHAAWSIDRQALKALPASPGAEEELRWDAALAALVRSATARTAGSANR